MNHVLSWNGPVEEVVVDVGPTIDVDESTNDQEKINVFGWWW